MITLSQELYIWLFSKLVCNPNYHGYQTVQIENILQIGSIIRPQVNMITMLTGKKACVLVGLKLFKMWLLLRTKLADNRNQVENCSEIQKLGFFQIYDTLLVSGGDRLSELQFLSHASIQTSSIFAAEQLLPAPIFYIEFTFDNEH